VIAAEARCLLGPTLRLGREIVRRAIKRREFAGNGQPLSDFCCELAVGADLPAIVSSLANQWTTNYLEEVAQFILTGLRCTARRTKQ